MISQSLDPQLDTVIPSEAPAAELAERVRAAAPGLAQLEEALNRVLLGKQALVRDLLTGVLAGGHVLLEGLPGLGKTELVKGFARLCDIAYSRVQFTPDLLPSDITGSFILQQRAGGERDFVFQEGPVFTNVLLGDEINRASPKTQSALLEAMAERCVTVLGETRRLPDPFFVIATQNPIELEGTYPLPEAQVDRFLFKLHLDRPSEEVLAEIVRHRAGGTPPVQSAVMSLADLRAAIALARDLYIAGPVAAYIARLIEATHPTSASAPETVRRYVRYGASPRAAICLGASARARAMLLGRPFAGFDLVRALFTSVCNHRLLLDYSARMDGVTVWQVLEDVLRAVPESAKPLPVGVTA